MNRNQQLVASLIRDVADFPKPGVLFKDITPLIASAAGYRAAVEELAAMAPPRIDVVVGMEARGFIFAGPVALELGAGFVPVRKPGKLPGKVYTESFALEYGTESLAVHADAILPGARVLVIDDVLATGGTMAAACSLIERAGGVVVGCAFLIELSFLNGRAPLAGRDCFSLITY